MAYKNNLLEYYGGGSVPYSKGYQEGGRIKEEDPVMFPAGENIFGWPTEAMTQSQFSDMLLDMMTGGVGGTIKKAAQLRKLGDPIPKYKKTGEKIPDLLQAEYKDYIESKMSPKEWFNYQGNIVRKIQRAYGKKSGYSRKDLGLGEKVSGEIPELKGKSKKEVEKLINEYGRRGLGKMDDLPKDLVRKFREGEAEYSILGDILGYKGGGSVGNSLLRMQYGGYTGGFGGTRVRSNLARYRKIKGASEDVSRRAKQIKEKKAKSGLFGKILGKAAEWGTGALLAPILGPGALIAAKAAGRGVGSYAGAKLGYGDKVGSGLGETQWLASDRKKLDRSEKGLEKSFRGTGYAGAAAGALKGATDYVQSQGAEGIEDWLQAKTGLKRNPFETPAYMRTPKGAPELISTPDVMIPSNNRLSLEGMQQKVSGLLPGTMEKSFSLSGQPESAYGLLSKLPSQEFAQEGFEFAGLPEPGEIGSEFLSGQYSPWGNMISGAYAGPMRQQQGGMVRDDNALIDMMYRR